MPSKRPRRSYEREARDDMFTDSDSQDDNAAWTPGGSRRRSSSKKRSRSVGPAPNHSKPSRPLLATSPVKRGGRSRSATPAPSSSRRRGPAPFERLPLPLPPQLSENVPTRLVLCGSNTLGQLGLGIEALKQGLPPLLQPERHPWFEAVAEESYKSDARGWALEQVACGSYHTLVLSSFGSVLSFGVNDNGALGRLTAPTDQGTTEELETQPIPIELNTPNFRPARICAGDSFGLALSDAGELRFWGGIRSSDGLLALSPRSKQKVTATPAPIAEAPKEPVVSIAAGCDHAVLLTADGHVWTFGNGQQGQLGRKIIERRKYHGLVPEKLVLGRKSVVIGAGTYTTFAVAKDGSTFACGLNQFRQCGVAEKDGGWLDLITIPTEIRALHPSKHEGARVISIVGGEHHTLFLLDNGQLWGCGRCDGGELGLEPSHPAIKAQLSVNPDAEPQEEDEKPRQLVCEPVQIDGFPAGDKVHSIASNGRHSFAVTQSGQVFAFGFSTDHALGSAGEHLVTPTALTSTAFQDHPVQAIAAGAKHTVFLTLG